MLLIYYEYIVARNVRNRCFTRADKSRVEDIPTGIIVVRNNNIINDMVEGAHIEGNMTSRTPRRCFVLVQFLQTMLGFELATPARCSSVYKTLPFEQTARSELYCRTTLYPDKLPLAEGVINQRRL